jgi:hypothetical protein
MVTTDQRAIRIPLVHVCELFFHGFGGYHGYVFKSQRFENIAVDIVIKG